MPSVYYAVCPGTGGTDDKKTSGASLTPTLRNSYSNYGSNSQTSVSVNAGDVIVVCYSANAGDASVSCSDNASGGSNTYTQIVKGSQSSITSAYMFYAVAKATATLTITCTWQSDPGLSVHVYYNVNRNSPVDVYSSDTTSAYSNSHNASLVTNNANDLLLFFFAQESASSSYDSFTNSFTERTEQSSHSHVTADRVVTSTGTYTTSATPSSSYVGVVLMAALKAATNPTITISSGVATLSVSQTGNIGQGFCLTFNVSTKVYISKVNSGVSFDVVTATGGTPSDVSTAVLVDSIAADYASLSAAEAGASDASHLNTSNLTTGSHVLNLVCYAGVSADTAQAVIDGWTTSASYYINVYTPRGLTYNESISNNRHSGTWDTSKYRLSISDNYALDLYDDYAVANGLQVEITSQTTARILVYLEATGVVLKNTLCRGYNSSTYSLTLINVYSGTATVSNCITLYTGNNSMTAPAIVASGTGNFYNCTFVGGSSTYGLRQTGGTCVAKNCYARGDTGYCYSGTITLTTCASADTTGSSGLQSIACDTSTFVNVTAGSEDYSLCGNSPLLMTGTGPSSDASIPTTDIASNTRAGTLTNIGAFHKAITNVYYSLSPYGTSDIKAGSPTCGISSGVMTLNTAQTGNIGQGCKITYDTSKVAYIKTVTDSTHFVVVDKYGVTPPDIASGTTVNSIAHNWASLSAAEAGADDSSYLNTADLTSANVTLNLACYYDHDDYTADTTNVSVAGWTATGLTQYIRVYAPKGGTESINSQRHDGKWNSNKYQLDFASGATSWLVNEEDYVVFEGLQVRHNPTGNCSLYEPNNYGNVGSSNLIIHRDCIYDGESQSYSQGITASGDDTLNMEFYNCIICNCPNSFFGNIRLNCATAKFYNCTISGGYYGARRNSGTWTFKNCAIFNNSDSDLAGFTLDTNLFIEYSAIDDASPTFTGKVTLGNSTAWGNAFTDYANGDFSLKSGSSLIGAGTDLSSYLTKDIIGTSRPQGTTWDIGAFEYISSLYSTADAIAAWKIITTSDRDAAWKIFAQADRDMAWQVLAYLTSDITSAWKMFTLADRDTAWKILAQADRDAAWKILKVIDRDAAWKVLATIDRSAAWKLLATSDRDTAWKILKVIDRDAAWKVLAVADRDLAYKVFKVADRDTAWQILNAVTQTSDATSSWKIMAQADRDLAYKIFNTFDRDTAWKILAQTDKSTAWKVFNALSNDAAWKILTVSDRNAAWQILGVLASDIGASWKILNTVDRNTAWKILAASDKDVAWKVFNTSDKDSGWKVFITFNQDTAWKIQAAADANAAWKVFNTMDQPVAWDVTTSTEIASGWKILNASDLTSAWSILSESIPEPLKQFILKDTTAWSFVVSQTTVWAFNHREGLAFSLRPGLWIAHLG